MKIVGPTPDLVDNWASMRAELWPDGSIDEHTSEIADYFSTGDQSKIALLAIDNAGEPTGFAEASLRHEYVEGCTTSPVAYLEGIYVRPQARRMAVGKALVDAIADWALAQGCSEFASDTEIANVGSQEFHKSLGFGEVNRVVSFRKTL